MGHLRGRCTRKVFPIIRKNGETTEPNAIKVIGNTSNSKSFGGNPQTGRVYGIDGIAPTLSTMQGGGQEPKVLDDQGRTKKRLKPLGISPTLRSQSHGNEPKVLVSKYERTDYGKQVRKDYEAKKVKLTGQDRHGVLTNGGASQDYVFAS